MIAQLVKNVPAMQETLVPFLGWEDPLARGYATYSSILGLPLWPVGKESTYNVGDLGLTPVLERSSGEGKDYPLLYSGLENSMGCVVHGVAKRRARLINFQFHWE